MVKRSFFFWVALVWFSELFLLPLLPFARRVLDPLLLLLIFLGFTVPSGRLLWLTGAGLGFLKDLASGGLFGAFTISFSGVGWILAATRHLVEREDSWLTGIWAGIFTLAGGLLYGLLVSLADPMVGWNRWWWGYLPVAMAVNGAVAAWGFPRLRR